VARVLVVDDEAANRLFVVTLLKHAGHEPYEADNGIDALLLAREAKPELIIIDLDLPRMTGAEFMKVLRGDPMIADIKVALYSATPMNMPIQDFMHLSGIRHVIPKPSEPEELLRLLSTMLE